MSTMYDSSGVYFPEEDSSDQIQYLEDSARSVELVREEGKDGQYSSFGFTLFQEKPPRIGAIVPGGPAYKANLKKGDIVLAVAGQDVTRLTHKEVSSLIRGIQASAVWLSICDGEEDEQNSSFNSSYSAKANMYASTPVINSRHDDSYSQKLAGLSSSYKAHNGSAMLTHYGSPKANQSPLIHKRSIPQNDPAYVTFVPPSYCTVTRVSTLLLYCGPVKIPNSWSNRGVSSLCIQECARQLLSKRKVEDFVKVQLEVSQNSMRITNTTGNILAKHHRYELYYCGLCSNDEQYFAIVTKSDNPTTVQAELCHVFKLMPESKLSTYVIDKSKSQREIRSSQPVSLKTCVDITETIQQIFQNENAPPVPTLKRNTGANSSDGIDYGVVHGISTLQLAPPTGESPPTNSLQGSPLLKRKKSNVIDLRSKGGTSSPPRYIPTTSKQRSTSIPINPSEHLRLTPTNSAGNIRMPPSESLHVRMHSDGSTGTGMISRPPLQVSILRTHAPQDVAKRISDSSMSSVSSDGHHSHSPSPSKTNSGSPTPNQQERLIAPGPLRKTSLPYRNGAVSPNPEGPASTKSQLRRQGSESSILDLPGLSPYHHLGLPRKNGHMTGSVDSIVTITTLAEDEVDTVVGQVAGWCGSFDKLLSDPLGVQYLLQFLETQHGEENILFWKVVQEFKKLPEANIKGAAKKIYDDFLAVSSSHSINVDDRVSKSIESNLKYPTRHIFDEAQREIYQLMKMDCYPRFKKWQVIKECLCAEMEGRPLPAVVQPVTSSQTLPKSSNTTYGAWGKKKNLSLLSKLRGLQHKSVTAPSLMQSTEHPLTQSVDVKKQKKEKKESSKKSRTKSVNDEEYYRPEESLKQFQVHKSNLFEVSLPNRVTKIIEAHPQTTIREAITHVLKKYQYSLDVMEVKLTNTLQPVNVNSPATVLIGKHVSITRSKHTVTVKFPDFADVILPADGSTTLRLLLDKLLSERGKTESYSAYLEGARAPLELNMSTAILEGHVVTINYNPPSTKPSNTSSIPPLKKAVFNLSSESGSSIGSSSSSGKGSEGVEELFSMIARLSSDTLLDQRISDDQPKRNSLKKGKSKFSRTKSGNAISENQLKHNYTMTPPRSYSPPAVMSQSLHPHRYHIPPSSDPPTLSLSVLNRPYGGSTAWSDIATNHSRQRSTDAMSGVSNESGSSVDSITHELAADKRMMNARNWVNNTSQLGMSTPHYFPAAFSSQDTLNLQPGGGASLNKRTSLPRPKLATSFSPGNYKQQGTWPQNGSELPPGGGVWLRPGPGSNVSGQQFSDNESLASSGCHSNANSKPPLSPTTHVLVIDENTQRSETIV